MTTYSASQIATAEDCLRKWAWDKIDGIKGDPNPHAQFGTATHDHLEAWLKAKTIPPDDTPEGVTAQAMIPALPPPQSVNPDDVEIKFGLMLGDFEFVGYIDLWVPNRDPRPLVCDHKTTGNLAYAKTPATLITDPQATLYGAWGMHHTNRTDIDLLWNYGTRHKRPKVLPVLATVTADDINPRLEQTIETARTLQAIHDSGVPAKDVPYDAAACEKYGGCPYRDRCNLTPQEILRSHMANEKTKGNFLAELRAKKASKSKGNGKAALPHPPPAKTPTIAVPESPINPPEAPVEVLVEYEAAPVPEPAPKRGRGRPKGSKNDAPPPAPPSAPAAPASAPQAAPRPHGFTLYVDCLPVKHAEGVDAPQRASDYVEAAMRVIRKAHGVGHYKLIGFGKGPGLLAVGVEEHLREHPPTSGSIYLTTRSNEERDCLQAFANAAAVVIHGQC